MSEHVWLSTTGRWPKKGVPGQSRQRRVGVSTVFLTGRRLIALILFCFERNEKERELVATDYVQMAFLLHIFAEWREQSAMPNWKQEQREHVRRRAKDLIGRHWCQAGFTSAIERRAKISRAHG
jgi:hypothetical protein